MKVDILGRNSDGEQGYSPAFAGASLKANEDAIELQKVVSYSPAFAGASLKEKTYHGVQMRRKVIEAFSMVVKY